MRYKRILTAISGTAVAGLAGLVGVTANAANPEPVVAEVEFVAPITITEINPLQFGLVDVNMGNGETIVIAPGGGITDAASNLLNAAQAAAALTVTATGGELISILVDNVTSGTGYALSAFQCAYDIGAAAGCDGVALNTTAAASGSASLTIGATLTGDGLATTGPANGSFDVTVAYQ